MIDGDPQSLHFAVVERQKSGKRPMVRSHRSVACGVAENCPISLESQSCPWMD